MHRIHLRLQIENIYWDNPHAGPYKIWVENNTMRREEGGKTPFFVRLTKNGKAEDRHFEDLVEYDEVLAFEFEL